MFHSSSIKGHYPTDEGFSSDPTRLTVIQDGRRWYAVAYADDEDRSFPIRAEAYTIADDLRGVEIVSDATEAEQEQGVGHAWVFWTTVEECRRVGLPIRAAAA